VSADPGLSTTAILRYTLDRLTSGGYSTAVPEPDDALPEKSALAEDPFGIALVAVYETWSELVESWADAQGYLVRRISDSLSSTNPKAWDGYLLLVTPTYCESERAEDAIRYDTSRVRKFVGTGDTIRSLADLDAVLLPLLPLNDSDFGNNSDKPLRERLYAMLCAQNVQPPIAESVLASFEQRDASVLEKLLDFSDS
jgi:hypothetical protein